MVNCDLGQPILNTKKLLPDENASMGEHFHPKDVLLSK